MRGAIFDQDGLLFDTEVVFERCWKAVGCEFGIEVPEEMTHALCGCGTNELPGVIGRFFPQLDVEAYVSKTFARVVDEQMAMTPVVKPGVREMLGLCREKGFRMAIATSSIRQLVDHNLATTGLTEFFDVIVTGPEVEKGKPAPDIFLLAAQRLGLPPSECFVFEDAMTGIRAAHAAGCSPVLIPDRAPPTSDILPLCSCFPSLLEARESLSRSRL